MFGGKVESHKTAKVNHVGKDYHGLNVTVPDMVNPHVSKFLEPSLHDSRNNII